MKRTLVPNRFAVSCALLVALGLLWTVQVGGVPGVPQLYSVNVDIVGEGSVTVSPAPSGEVGPEVTYTQDKSILYEDANGLGADVLCTAEADAGWQFVRWERGRVGAEAATTANPAHLLLVPGGGTPSYWTLRALFVRLYTIEVSADPTAGGTVSGGGAYVDGDPVTVVATAKDCYTFVNWTEGGVEVSTSASYSFTATGNRTLVAHFALTTYTISVSADPTAGGTAAVTGGATHNCGTQVTVVATPNNCYTFVNWTEGATAVSTSASYSFTATGNRTLVAHFALTTYTISVSADPTAGGTAEVTGGATHNCGTQVTVVATPNNCYTFVNWTEGATAVSTSASYSFTATGNRTLVAHFALTTYTISVSADPTAGGTAAVTGGATHNCGTQVTVVATPNNCYTFVNWTEGATAVSTSASYSFTATGNRTLVAHFSQLPPADLFFDDMESGTNGWKASAWYLLAPSCCPNMPSPTHVWGFGKSTTGKLPSKGTLTSASIDVAGQASVDVEFWYCLKRNTTKTYVRAKVEYLAGKTWKTLWTLPTNPTGVWTRVGPLQVTIPVGVTKLQLRFSVTAASGKGCFTIDDVRVSPVAAARNADSALLCETDASDEFAVESVENVPNPIRDVHTTRFTVKGVGIEEICVNIYDQSGMLVFTSGWQPNGYNWHVETNEGETLANGVYLYTVLVRGANGEVILTEVRKLAVYR